MASVEGRIIQEHRTSWTIATEGGEVSATVRGKFHAQKKFPRVGDYVQYTTTGSEGAVIEEVLPRTSEIVRLSRLRDKRDAHTTSEVIVANVDIIFIVMGLDNDFNVSRAERYASLAKQSNVHAVLLLNKRDTVSDVASYVAQITERLPGMTAHAISAKTGENMESLLEYLSKDTTAVLLGSSGAGKSSITNWLLGHDKQAVRTVRDDDSRGKHTTTARELFAIPSGGFLIDTPGMRELGIIGETEDVFTTLEELVVQCQFTDCDHEKTKGCALQGAVKRGDVPMEQLANFLKLQREREYNESKSGGESGQVYKQDKKKRDKKNVDVAYTKYQRRGAK